MSRTHRNHALASAFGRYWIGIPESQWGRDRKPWFKSPGWYKRMRNRIRRAKAKQAMRRRMEPVTFKRNNDWDWS